MSCVHARPGAIVRRVFHPTRKLVRFSLLKCPSIPNSKFGTTYSPWRSVSYRPFASPSYEASSHVKKLCLFRQIIIIIIIIKHANYIWHTKHGILECHIFVQNGHWRPSWISDQAHLPSQVV